MAEDMLTMSQRELKRLFVIRKVLSGELTQAVAASQLSLGIRQVRRLVRRVRLEGDVGVAHKLRGKASGRQLDEGVKQRAIALYREKYLDFGPTFASEKLSELDGIKVSDETLRMWLKASGDWHVSRKGRKHRQRRERKTHLGVMLQMDGSHHAWLEDRGPKLVFMGCIDDATSRIFGRFYDYEGTLPAMDVLRRYSLRYGLPQSVYVDRHTTYKSPEKATIEDDLNGRKSESQFERALRELGVMVIHARSPQAKGRVERMFKTLQDRLVKELRLKGIASIEEANRFVESYLDVHNKRFGVEAVMGDDLHVPVTEQMKLDDILCIKTEHALRNDYTVSHNTVIYQIVTRVNAKKVQVEEKLDGRIVIRHKSKALRFEVIASRPERPKTPITYKTRKKHIPPPNHPWRKHSITPK
ncbi:MAG: hypothetical protein A3J24_00155 [Deltaproteobacteria bacterium RIFCSPLOWO2_02_FULL_53_8]|nr:MAG: hypothetical protein A3J24_00155 [Deltaproteobacteria bacterium RIFCSPLOWO2_02_FULL_53_8]